MIKRVLALCLCVCLVFCLGACKKDRFEDEETITPIIENSTPQEETSSGEETPEETPKKEDNAVVDTSNDNSFPIKIVSTKQLESYEINERFEKAAKIYTQLSYNCVPVDWALGPKQIKKDGSTNTYFRVSDSRFDSVAELEKYLNEFFTPECIKTFYNPANFVDYEGHLYAISGTGGDDSLLAGCVFTVTKQTTMRVFFTANIYSYKKIQDKPAQAEIFTEQPKDVTIYNNKTVDFVYEISSDNKNWKFSKFGNII
jgi:hypothetical protein